MEISDRLILLSECDKHINQISELTKKCSDEENVYAYYDKNNDFKIEKINENDNKKTPSLSIVFTKDKQSPQQIYEFLEIETHFELKDRDNLYRF